MNECAGTARHFLARVRQFFETHLKKIQFFSSQAFFFFFFFTGVFSYLRLPADNPVRPFGFSVITQYTVSSFS